MFKGVININSEYFKELNLILSRLELKIGKLE